MERIAVFGIPIKIFWYRVGVVLLALILQSTFFGFIDTFNEILIFSGIVMSLYFNRYILEFLKLLFVFLLAIVAALLLAYAGEYNEKLQ